MTTKPMATYLSALTADYTAEILDIPVYRVIRQKTSKEQYKHRFSDGQHGIVTLSNQSQNVVTVQYKNLTPARAGIITDLWNAVTKGNGMARSWYWEHAAEGYIYTVKFAEPLDQAWVAGVVGRSEIKQIKLDVWGTKP